MVIGIQSVLWLTVAALVLVEGRSHHLRMRKHRGDQEVPRSLELERELVELLSGDLQVSRSEELSFDRHRRHRPAALTDSDDNSEEVLDDGTDIPEPKLDEEEDFEDLEEMRRAPRHRLLNHRHRVHPRAKHLRHRHNEKHRAALDFDDSPLLELEKEHSHDPESDEAKDLLWERVRGKRHNRRRVWTEKDKKSYISSRPKPIHFESEKTYELEVREAQNSSLCNYTVIPIPNPGGRIPRDLEHVKCNYAGSKCQEKGTYCCIQTYRNVEVVYEDGKTESMKIYSGCVCSLQIYGTLEPYTPELDINY